MLHLGPCLLTQSRHPSRMRLGHWTTFDRHVQDKILHVRQDNLRERTIRVSIYVCSDRGESPFVTLAG
jgi:hypothetical protein